MKEPDNDTFATTKPLSMGLFLLSRPSHLHTVIHLNGTRLVVTLKMVLAWCYPEYLVGSQASTNWMCFWLDFYCSNTSIHAFTHLLYMQDTPMNYEASDWVFGQHLCLTVSGKFPAQDWCSWPIKTELTFRDEALKRQHLKQPVFALCVHCGAESRDSRSRLLCFFCTSKYCKDSKIDP